MTLLLILCSLICHILAVHGCLKCFNFKRNAQYSFTSPMKLSTFNHKMEIPIRYNHKNVNGSLLSNEMAIVRLFDSENNIDSKFSVNIKEIMIDAIKWYKSTLSPLMPPNCIFIPSCSSYGTNAIEKFGSMKGLILTAWRIFRCNPTGGS